MDLNKFPDLIDAKVRDDIAKVRDGNAEVRDGNAEVIHYKP